MFATLITPREEEPQIDVTMADVLVAFPGASAKDVENLVARPAEQVLSRIAGVEHVYSVSRPGMAVITVQFEVGVKYHDPPWCASTTPCIRTATGCRPTSACRSR
jgi:multidrug efflux pump subunit AcrB